MQRFSILVAILLLFGCEEDPTPAPPPDPEPPGREKTATYATECRTDVDNATVYIPEGTEWSGLPRPEVGDTIALFAPDSSCVGFRAWDSTGAALAAANRSAVMGAPGLDRGDPITFEVYIRAKDRAFRSRPSFVSCLDTGVPVCEDSNAYRDGAFFEVRRLSVPNP